MTRKARPTRLVICIVTLAAGVTVGAVAASAASADPQPKPPSKSQALAPHYPRNASGMTYGSNRDATSPDNLPDLILAITTNGKEGYVKRLDLLGTMPKNPQDAVRMQSTPNLHNRHIPVYDQSGNTVIGEFVVQ